MRSCIGRVSGPGLSSRNCQSAVCAADKRHERSGGRLWATSRNRGRAYHPLFGALALGSKNIGRLGGTVAHLFRSLMVFFSYHLYLHSVGERSSPWSSGGRSSYLQMRTDVVYWLWLMWVRGGSRMVLLSYAGGFVFSSCGRRSSLRWRASFALCAAGGRRCGSAVSAARRHYLYFLSMCTEG